MPKRALTHIRRSIVENRAHQAWDRENREATTPEEPNAWRV